MRRLALIAAALLAATIAFALSLVWVPAEPPPAPCPDGFSSCATQDGASTVKGLAFVSIPAGAFLAGCIDGDDHCEADEKPARSVAIAAFRIGRTEVPWSAYRDCVRDGACVEPARREWKCWFTRRNPSWPVNCLNAEAIRRAWRRES